ncbi:MAG: glycosyltransferase [Clostridia bacterium]|nr:glycosyltransferase [Clostridia bacterium]
MSKILYVASTKSHLDRFHQPYIKALKEKAEVYTMATGEGVDFPILFDKHFFSFSNFKSILKIRKILKKERFDAVLLHTTLAAFLVRAAMIGMRNRPYVLNTVHGYLFTFPPRTMKDRILLRCEKLLRKKTDDIAVMNREDGEICKRYRLCRDNVYMTRGMGVSITPQIPEKDLELRAQYAKDDKEFICLFVGELSHRKNQSFLIQAAKKLHDLGFPIKLLLAGDGGDREELERMIQENFLENTVFLLGNREPILPFLSIADLYVSASHSEGLPFNIMEAMSCGLPILASDTKGQTDLLEEREDSLYPHGDIDAFCFALRAVYRNGSYGVGTRSYPSLEQYRLSAVFEENEKLFLSVITKERKKK